MCVLIHMCNKICHYNTHYNTLTQTNTNQLTNTTNKYKHTTVIRSAVSLVQSDYRVGTNCGVRRTNNSWWQAAVKLLICTAEKIVGGINTIRSDKTWTSWCRRHRHLSTGTQIRWTEERRSSDVRLWRSVIDRQTQERVILRKKDSELSKVIISVCFWSSQCPTVFYLSELGAVGDPGGAEVVWATFVGSAQVKGQTLGKRVISVSAPSLWNIGNTSLPPSSNLD